MPLEPTTDGFLDAREEHVPGHLSVLPATVTGMMQVGAHLEQDL